MYTRPDTEGQKFPASGGVHRTTVHGLGRAACGRSSAVLAMLSYVQLNKSQMKYLSLSPVPLLRELPSCRAISRSQMPWTLASCTADGRAITNLGARNEGMGVEPRAAARRCLWR